MNKPAPAVRRPRGFTLIETLISTMLVGIVLVSALRALGNLTRHQTEMDLQAVAKRHAEELLDEILEKSYADPDGDSVPQWFFFYRIGDKLAPEGDEADGTRLRFDDVDDFHQWASSPLTRRDGSPISLPGKWQRTVDVDYVRPDDLASRTLLDSGVKRIRVTVRKDGEPLAEAMAFRTRGWDQSP